VEAVQVERFELRASLRVRRGHQALTFEAEHVKHDVSQPNVRATVEEPFADEREVRGAGRVEGDQFAVEDPARRERCKFWDEFGHVQATPAAETEAILGAEEAAEPVPLDLETPLTAGRDRLRPGKHRLW
jgi:hypothetical protein